MLQSMGSEESDMTERLNRTELNMSYIATVAVQKSQIDCILKKKGKACRTFALFVYIALAMIFI